MWRVVMRPCELRPPVRFLPRMSALVGLWPLRSFLYSIRVIWRWLCVVGFSFFILRDGYRLSFFKVYVCFFAATFHSHLAGASRANSFCTHRDHADFAWRDFVEQ